MFHPGKRPGFADRRATLGHNTSQGNLAADGHGHSAVFKYFALQINLRERFRKLAAGQPAINRLAGITRIPRAQPGFGIQMKRVNEGQPAVRVGRCHAVFHRPKMGSFRRRHLVLREPDAFQFGLGQVMEGKNQAAGGFDFLRIGHQAGARAARQQGNAGVHPQDLQNLFRVRKEFRRHEHQSQRHLRRGQTLP